jgi:hypothetical protein
MLLREIIAIWRNIGHPYSYFVGRVAISLVLKLVVKLVSVVVLRICHQLKEEYIL